MDFSSSIHFFPQQIPSVFALRISEFSQNATVASLLGTAVPENNSLTHIRPSHPYEMQLYQSLYCEIQPKTSAWYEKQSGSRAPVLIWKMFGSERQKRRSDVKLQINPTLIQHGVLLQNKRKKNICKLFSLLDSIGQRHVGEKPHLDSSQVRVEPSSRPISMESTPGSPPCYLCRAPPTWRRSRLQRIATGRL